MKKCARQRSLSDAKTGILFNSTISRQLGSPEFRSNSPETGEIVQITSVVPLYQGATVLSYFSITAATERVVKRKKPLWDKGLCREAPPGFEPGMADLQSAALAAWLRRLVVEARSAKSASGDEGNCNKFSGSQKEADRGLAASCGVVAESRDRPETGSWRLLGWKNVGSRLAQVSGENVCVDESIAKAGLAAR